MKSNKPAKKDLKSPGETAGRTGEYVERGPRGGAVKNARQITIDNPEKTLSATQEKGRTWERIGPPDKT